MNIYQIYTKRTNNGCEYIKIISSLNKALYSYYGLDSIDEPVKSTFNKYSFIEFLRAKRIPKKYINEVENLKIEG